MYPSIWESGLTNERIAEQRAEAEERRLAWLVAGPTLRARAARKLFEFAFALERRDLARGVGEAGGAEASLRGEEATPGQPRR